MLMDDIKDSVNLRREPQGYPSQKGHVRAVSKDQRLLEYHLLKCNHSKAKPMQFRGNFIEEMALKCLTFIDIKM